MNALRDVPESEVVRQVKEVIDITGLEIQRVNVGCFAVGEGRTKRFVRTAKKGTLDYEGYDNYGRHVGIECKRPVGGRLSDEQAERRHKPQGRRCVCSNKRRGSDGIIKN